MALNTKTDPVDVDVAIDLIQRSLFTQLTTQAENPWSNYESYYRAYKNTKKDSIIPEWYEGKRDYLEVFYDDKFSVSSFFLTDDERIETEPKTFSHGVSMIFQANLKELYPGIAHRADEEMHNDILVALDQARLSLSDVSLVTGISNVYSDLSLSVDLLAKLQTDDMEQCHLVRVSFDVMYGICKSTTHII